MQPGPCGDDEAIYAEQEKASLVTFIYELVSMSRRYGVKKGIIPSRKERKEKTQENTAEG
jgi:hypothetical protein